MKSSHRQQKVLDKRGSLTQVNLYLPRELLNFIDNLIEKGLYVNRSEAVRAAITLLRLLEKGEEFKGTYKISLVPPFVLKSENFPEKFRLEKEVF